MGSKVGGKVTVEVKIGVLLIIGKGFVPVVDNVLVIMAVGVFTGLHDANVMEIRTVNIAFLILLDILKCFKESHLTIVYTAKLLYKHHLSYLSHYRSPMIKRQWPFP